MVGGSLQTTARGSSTLTNASTCSPFPAGDAALGIPVLVKGVVTAGAETTPNWKGRFFMQDASGGVFVDNKNCKPQPVVGDVVEVSGISHPGRIGSDYRETTVEKTGTAPLPDAKAGHH